MITLVKSFLPLIQNSMHTLSILQLIFIPYAKRLFGKILSFNIRARKIKSSTYLPKVYHRNDLDFFKTSFPSASGPSAWGGAIANLAQYCPTHLNMWWLYLTIRVACNLSNILLCDDCIVTIHVTRNLYNRIPCMSPKIFPSNWGILCIRLHCK